MPIYQYKCESCEHKFEDIVKYFGRKKRKKCPLCGKVKGIYLDEAQPFVYSLGRSFSRMRHGK